MMEQKINSDQPANEGEDMTVIGMEEVSLEEAGAVDIEDLQLEHVEKELKPPKRTSGRRTIVLITMIGLCVAVAFAVVAARFLNNRDESSSQTEPASESTPEFAAAVLNETMTPFPGLQEQLSHRPLLTKHAKVNADKKGTVDTAQTPLGNATLRPFSKDILEGYSSKDDFEADLVNAMNYIGNKIILWNLEAEEYYQQNVAGTVAESTSAPSTSVNKKQFRSFQEDAKKASKTNMQEKDSDEADVVESDGQYIYVGYGDYMLVWDLEGEIVKQIHLPDAPPSQWKAYIVSIIVTDKHVLLVAGGYASDLEEDSEPILVGINATRLFVYTKPSPDDTEMSHVASRTLNGLAVSGRWMSGSNSIHIVTNSAVDVYKLLEPLDFFTRFSSMTRAEYQEAASELASRTLIQNFVQAVMKFLSINGSLPKMLQLNSGTKKTDAPPRNESLFEVNDKLMATRS